MKHQRLIDIIHEEHKEYLENLKQKSPDEIIRSAYEICYREEFICLLESTLFDDDVIDELLRLPNPVGMLYSEWLKTDASICDMLEDVIRDFARE